MKRLIALVFAAGMLIGTPAADADTTLVFGGSDAPGSIFDRQNQKFTDLVNEANVGLTVNFIQGEALGSDREVIEQMMEGAVQLYGDELGWYANWVDDFSILTWGFTFNNRDHIAKFLDSDVFKKLSDELIEQNVRVLAAAPVEPRVMFSKVKIEKPEDLNGLKMRVPGIRPFLLLWQQLGTEPTQVAWGETYIGLRTGLVDATDGPISSGAAARFQEVTDYLVRTDHLLSIGQISIAENAWQSLTDEQKKVVQDAARQAVEWSAEEAQKSTDKQVSELVAAGMTEVQVDPAAFADLAREGVAEMESSGAWSPGLWEQIRALD